MKEIILIRAKKETEEKHRAGHYADETKSPKKVSIEIRDPFSNFAGSFELS